MGNQRESYMMRNLNEKQLNTWKQRIRGQIELLHNENLGS